VTSLVSTGEDFRGTPRFLVLRRLGAGGAGVVYEAYDREQGARIALKVLRHQRPDMLLRFKNEFRALQDVHHTNLVSLGELFEDGGVWFFTMEYVDGVDLLSYVNRAVARSRSRAGDADRTAVDTLVDSEEPTPVFEVDPTRPSGASAAIEIVLFDERKLRSAMVQLVRGVKALHAAGKVHRDIKASNVLVTADGRAVLLDFGLIMETRQAREEAETQVVVGTEKYMAPEQAASLPVGPQADCYSLGVVLYRAMTGLFPFGDASGVRLAARKQHPPKPPRELAPGTPADLDALCMELLEPAPERRPTCDQILDRLLGKGGAIESLAPLSAASVAGPFVGRDLELAILRDAFDETLGGGTCAIAVLGESGVGKSTLARRFGEMVVEETGAVLLASRCYERESVPYKAVDGLIDQLSRVLARTPDVDLAEIAPRRAGLLAHAFPVLRKVGPFREGAPTLDAPATTMVDPKEQRARLFSATRELFVNLANRLPVVITIDDLQWSDADSLAMLREILRGPDGPAVLLLATARQAGDAGPEPALEALGEVRTLSLDRLDPEDARDLARRLLAGVPWGDDALAERIAREAGGHPLFIDELVRHALQGGEGGEERARTARLEDAVAERVARLDAAQRTVVEAVAVAGGPLRIEVAAEATGLELATLVRAVSRLRAANLARASGVRRGDSVEAYHDRVRDAVLARVGAEARRTWHRRIATALEAKAPEFPGRAPPPAAVDALVTHWRGAQDRAKTARYALMAAAHASDALAFDRAAGLYELALAQGSSTPADIRAIRTNLAIALVNAGRGGAAASAFLAAAEGAEGDEAIELQRRAAEQLLFSGHLDEGNKVLQRVLGAMGMEVPRTHRSALASLLVRRGQLRLRGLEFKERTEAECAPADLVRLDMLSSLSSALGMVDTVRGADFQTRHALLALKTGEPMRVLRALSLEAAYSATGGSTTHDRTAAIVIRTRELAQRFVTDPLAQGYYATGAAAAAFLEGRWREAYELFSEVATTFRERIAAQAFVVDSANFYLLGALMHLGELKQLGLRIPILLEEATQRGDRYALTHLRTGILSIAWLARGDPAGARREAEDAIRRWSTEGTHLPHFLDVLAQAQIDLYEGKPRVAFARVVDRWDALQKAFLLRVQFIRIKMLELRGRAALAVAAAAPADAAVHTKEGDRCAGEIEEEETRWGAPLAKMLRAGACALRGEIDEARRLFAAAEREFASEEMALHVAIARARHAELFTGEASLLLRAAAITWMQEQGIADPERLTTMIAPRRTAPLT
jgi:serine/threonine protein kinase